MFPISILPLASSRLATQIEADFSDLAFTCKSLPQSLW
jgi:hypothetical protein